MPRKTEKITNPSEVERICRTWMMRLGLGSWRIGVTWEDRLPTQDGTGDATASVRPSRHYESATLFLSRQEILGMTRVEINELAAHEAFHLMRRDLDDDFIERFRQWLPPTVFESESARHSHEIEKYVERLSRIIVELGGVV